MDANSGENDAKPGLPATSRRPRAVRPRAGLALAGLVCRARARTLGHYDSLVEQQGSHGKPQEDQSSPMENKHTLGIIWPSPMEYDKSR